MQNQLFRQESIDRVSSQDQVRDYLRVTSPKMWMVIAAVAALAAGFLFFMSSSGQEITVPVKVTAENVQAAEGHFIQANFEIPPGDKDNYRPGMAVRFAGVTGEIRYVFETGDATLVSAEVTDPEARVADGEYDAAVVIEANTPVGELLK